MQSQAALAATSCRHADHWRPWPWPPSPIRPFPRRMAVAPTQPRSISANGRLPAYWPATGAATRMPGCQRLWPACKSTASTPFGHLRHAAFQNGPFGIAIWAVWRCKTGRFTMPYGTYRRFPATVRPVTRHPCVLQFLFRQNLFSILFTSRPVRVGGQGQLSGRAGVLPRQQKTHDLLGSYGLFQYLCIR